MKSLYFALAFVLMLGGAFAQSVPQTPNIHLNEPPYHYQRWDVPNNANWNTLDSFWGLILAGCGGDGSHGIGWDPVLHFTCVGITGTAGPGGSSGQLQYNNAGALGGFNDGTALQVLHGLRTFGPVTRLDTDSTIAQTGIDINTSFQVTSLHLSAPCPIAMGCTGTATPGLVGGTNITITGTWPNQTVTSLGGAPGGSTTQVEFNDAGTFGGNSAFTFNKTAGVAFSNYLATKNGPLIDPKAYGAVGDCSVDDTVAMQAAEAAMQALHGEVFLGGNCYKLNRVQVHSGDTFRGVVGIGGRETQIQAVTDAAFVSATPTSYLASVTFTDIDFRVGKTNPIDIPFINDFDFERITVFDATGCGLALVDGERWIIRDYTFHSTGASGFAQLCTGDTTKSLFTGSLTPSNNYGMARGDVVNLRNLGSIGSLGFSTQWTWYAGSGTGGLVHDSNIRNIVSFFTATTGVLQMNNCTNSHFDIIDLDHVGQSGTPEPVGINIAGTNAYCIFDHYNPGFNTNFQTTQMYVDTDTFSTIANSHFGTACNNSTTFCLKLGPHAHTLKLDGDSGGLYTDPAYLAGGQEVSIINSQMSPNNAAGGAILSNINNFPIQVTLLGAGNNAAPGTGQFRVCRGAGDGTNGTYPCDFFSDGSTFTSNLPIVVPSCTGCATTGTGTPILSAGGHLLAVEYTNSASTPVYIEIYPQGTDKPNEGDAAVAGTIAWAVAQLTGGGQIKVKTGTYTVSTTITISTAGTLLTCDDPASVNLTAAASFNSIILKVGWAGAQRQGMGVYNCGFNGSNATNTSGQLVWARDLANSHFEGNYFTFAATNGMVLDATTSGMVQDYVTNNIFRESGQEEFILNTAAGGTVTDSIISGNQIGGSVLGDSTKPWVTVNSLGSLQFTNNHISGLNHTSCMIFTSTSQTDVAIVANEFENCPQHGLVITGQGATITGNLFYNNGTSASNTYADIYLEQSANTTVTANIFRGQSQAKNCIFSDGGTILGTFTGNVCTGHTGIGILIANNFSGGNIIGLNQFYNNGGADISEAATHWGTNDVSLVTPAALLPAAGQLSTYGFKTNALTTGSTPTITTQGAAGSTTWTYTVVPKDINGSASPASAGGSTATGNATLTGSNFNVITWQQASGAYSYDVYRTAVGTSPTTTGKIGNVLSTALLSGNGSFFLNDTGLAGDSATAPTTNTSGSGSFGGPVIEALGKKFTCTHGTNATCGIATLSGGTVTVSTTAIAAIATAGNAGDAVELILQSCSTCGTLSVGTVTAGTSFVINSTNGADASNVYWEIKHIN